MNVQVSGQPASLTRGYCIVAAQPKRRLLPKTTRWVSPQGLAPRFPLPCWGHTYAFDCYLLVSATTYCVFANSCHTIMYYSVFRFVYAHFIVAIIDSCCMDEKKIWIKQYLICSCNSCVVTASLRARLEIFTADAETSIVSKMLELSWREWCFGFVDV